MFSLRSKKLVSVAPSLREVKPPSKAIHLAPRSSINIILAVKNVGQNELDAIDYELKELESRKQKLLRKRHIIEKMFLTAQEFAD